MKTTKLGMVLIALLLFSACKKEQVPPQDCSNHPGVQALVNEGDYTLLNNPGNSATVTQSAYGTTVTIGFCTAYNLTDAISLHTSASQSVGDGYSQDTRYSSQIELAAGLRAALNHCTCGI